MKKNHSLIPKTPVGGAPRKPRRDDSPTPSSRPSSSAASSLSGWSKADFARARRAAERTQMMITRHMEGKSFRSPKEATEYANRTFVGRKVPNLPPRNPVEEAQLLIYDAWDSRSPDERIRLARKALEISPDCADAYVILAEDSAGSAQEAAEFYEKGVRAGERALGPEYFREDVGHFWGVVETRPYMRAKLGLAEVLWALSRPKEAIAEFRDILRLSPNDNQGARYSFISLLLEEGQDDEAAALIKRFPGDPLTPWPYSEALLLFRKEGATARAARKLRDALERNPFVPLTLLDPDGGKGPDDSESSGEAVDSEGEDLPVAFDEAVEYATLAFEAWMRTPNAFEWLTATMRKMVEDGEKGKRR